MNNLLLVDFDQKFIQKIKKVLHKRFQMINTNFFAYYFDMNVQRDKQQRTFYFNQKIYLKKIIRNHDMWKCNFMIIFMKINIKFIVVEVDYICFINDKHRYQSIVDFFMYVMFEIRSNIIYVVSIINWYVFNSNKSHWKVVKRIFRYFRYFLNFCFIFIDVFQSLKNYIDVDWVDNHNTRRSIFDYVFNLKNVVINWFSKRQFIVILSTCEIKYIN